MPRKTISSLITESSKRQTLHAWAEHIPSVLFQFYDSDRTLAYICSSVLKEWSPTLKKQLNDSLLVTPR